MKIKKQTSGYYTATIRINVDGIERAANVSVWKTTNKMWASSFDVDGFIETVNNDWTLTKRESIDIVKYAINRGLVHVNGLGLCMNPEAKIKYSL